jgi:hypothetical protein
VTEYGFAIPAEGRDSEEMRRVMMLHYAATRLAIRELALYEPVIAPGPNEAWYWYVNTDA